MERLQRLQNSTACLVTHTRKHERMSAVLNSLHWLPFKYRSQYNILVYAYKALHGTALQYLEELVVAYHPTRSVRSESKALLTIAQTHGVKYSKSCFGKAATNLWNHLPDKIRKLKPLMPSRRRWGQTFLFQLFWPNNLMVYCFC